VVGRSGLKYPEFELRLAKSAQKMQQYIQFFLLVKNQERFYYLVTPVLMHKKNKPCFH